jgi:hypothetical protein
VAVIAFFRALSEHNWWRTPVAPLVGLAGLRSVTVRILKHLCTLSGAPSTLVNALPYVVIATAVAVGVSAERLRPRRARRYAQLGSLADPSARAEVRGVGR